MDDTVCDQNRSCVSHSLKDILKITCLTKTTYSHLHILGYCIKNTEWKHLEEKEKIYNSIWTLFKHKDEILFEMERLLYSEIVFAMF